MKKHPHPIADIDTSGSLTQEEFNSLQKEMRDSNKTQILRDLALSSGLKIVEINVILLEDEDLVGTINKK